MPNLGPGVDQHVNTAPVPTWVFSPTPNAPSTVRLYNEGSQILYVGGVNVSPFNGLPIAPGNKPLEMQNALGTIYTCSNAVAGAVGGTVTSASTAGQTQFVTAASVATSGFSPGATFILGSAGSQEVLVVNTVSVSFTTIGTTTGALYDHKASSPVYPATSTIGQLRVTAGVL